MLSLVTLFCRSAWSQLMFCLSKQAKQTNKQRTNKKIPLSLYEKLPRVAITFLANMLIGLTAKQPFRQEAILIPQEGRAGAGQSWGEKGIVVGSLLLPSALQMYSL